MYKRVIIAGCRDYNNYEEAKRYIDFCISNLRKKYNIIIVSGGAKGADALGERYATENKFEIERYPAEWSKYGRGAGPRRNKLMVEVCDYVICFWDKKSKGTKSTIDLAVMNNKPIRIKYI